MPRSSAIIVAAGAGKRMQNSTPKQFLLLQGQSVLYHSLHCFNAAPSVSEIIIVVAQCYLDSAELQASIPSNLSKTIRLVVGGAHRQDSVFNGLKVVDAASEIVIVHDAVRPFITPALVEETIRQCARFDGAVAAIPATDTLKHVEDGLISATLDRSSIWQVQTPQAFGKDILLQAFQQAEEDNFYGTDEAGLVERIGAKVAVVMGDRRNIKITCPEDIPVAEVLIRDWQQT